MAVATVETVHLAASAMRTRLGKQRRGAPMDLQRSGPLDVHGSAICSQIKNDAGARAVLRSGGIGRDRAAQQHLIFAAGRERLLEILDRAADDPRRAGAANARAAAENRRQPDRFGEFEQAALVA